jgi:uncharacterized protein YdeI (YjbR/CyaY-like superfamily)
MELGKTLYVTSRNEWRAWLEKRHASEKEIWLVFYNKRSGKPSLPYNDAVDEALCFGWIDSTVKKVDEERRAQRFTPRRKGSPVSEMNKERARRMIKAGLMTQSGLAVLGDLSHEKFVFPDDIISAIKSSPEAWRNFQKFSKAYKMIRIGYIDGARDRPEEFKKRLAYFMKMTAKSRKFGMVQ